MKPSCDWHIFFLYVTQKRKKTRETQVKKTFAEAIKNRETEHAKQMASMAEEKCLAEAQLEKSKKTKKRGPQKSAQSSKAKKKKKASSQTNKNNKVSSILVCLNSYVF